MFRKSVFIMLFVCLLAPVAMAAYPWDNQLEWRSGAADANWYNAANWTQEGALPCPTDGSGPGPNFLCAILPNQPGPRLGLAEAPNATCSMLDLNPWDPTSWGGQDVNVTIEATAGDINCGAAIQVNSWASYDSYLGTASLVSRAILNVYGGMVTAPSPANTTNLCGLRVGGGGDGFGLSYGMVNIYGGEVSVPRVELNFGEIGLYGGVLRINTDPNLFVRTDHPIASLNLIKINGGSLVLLGDQTVALSPYITSGRIICERGTLNAPTYDGTWTTLAADINYTSWNPQPANGATNIHYYNPDGNSITLSWRPSTFEDIDVNHDVYFGTSFADVNTATKTSPQYMGSLSDPCDPCSYVVKDPNKFLPFVASTISPPFPGTGTYYWRVDEESNSGSTFKKGLIWSFTTHDGKAYSPRPVDDANLRGLDASLRLSWTAGDFTQPASGHRVFFGTNFSAVNNATTSSTDGRYRGTVSSPYYPLSRLAEKGANLPGASFVLTTGKTYYWRIDEVNGTTVLGTKGNTWSFTPDAYLNIDDFEDSQSTDDVNTRWPDHYSVTGCTGLTGNAKRILIRDSSGKYMQYTYNNSGQNPAFGGMAFSEAKRPYSGGTSLTGGGVISPAPKALRIDYRGTAVNVVAPTDDENIDPNADTMYVAIEDTAGNVSVYLNPDHQAQQVGNWTSWYTSLTDINVIGNTNLNAVTGFAIGFGVRCMNYAPYFDGQDTNSIVLFDNIRLYAATCVPQYGPSADLDEDCDVDINDMDRLANDWLSHAENFVFSPCTQPAKAPVLWYKFNGADQNNVTPDYGTGDANHYTGTINAFISQNWKAGKGRNGETCLYLPPGGGCYVNAPVGPYPTTEEALGFMGDAAHTAPFDGNAAPGGGGVSFSIWINADMTANNMQTSWNGLFGTWNGAVTTETLEIHCPSPTVPPACNFIKRTWGPGDITAGSGGRPAGDFGGRWNHFAFVKEPNSMKLYINGNMVRYVDANLLPNDPNAGAYGPLVDPNVGAFRIGTRGGNWGMWNGYMQDFQVYDYALTAAEVAYLATDGVGEVFLPLVSQANINTDGSATPATDVNQTVDFGDIAIMGKQWHTTVLWP